MDRTPKLDQLKEATRQTHERLHHHPQLIHLIDKHITLDYLGYVLERFLTFHHGVETAILESDHALAFTKHRTPIINALKHDLGFVDNNHIGKSFVPSLNFDALENVWAYLYFREGSLLGGRVIHKALLKHLTQYSDKFTYFKGLQEETVSHWQEFKNVMEHEIEPLKFPLICRTANTLFLELYEWLDFS